VQEPQTLSPARKGHFRLREEESLRRPLAGAAILAVLLQRFLLARVCDQACGDPHGAWIARLRQLQWNGARRFHLIEDQFDDAPVFRLLFSHPRELAGVEHELFEERGNVQHEAFRRKPACESRGEVERSQGNGSGH